MARTCKVRRICQEPPHRHFISETAEQSAKEMVLTIDEYEAIRIIDFEGLSQEQCAVQMNVARTTGQLIYNTAKHKIAEALVKGMSIRIDGGHVEVCDGSKPCNGGCSQSEAKKQTN